ncbi:MAG TPA: selenoneine biosynthesis selenosugar synthase SenB [Casimicrobiaceae bacterium]|nr:selenoneine biosynthesis selenosugar synthase SenB [Casimicrobiaceae bacterium]
MTAEAKLVIVSPASRDANNGNWRTADRWSHFLRRRFDVEVCMVWTTAAHPPECMIALHARRSAGALATFAEACPNHARVLVLTGTDLYRDIGADATARRSLDLATHLVVLQDAGLDALQPRHRDKCRVIFQSALALAPNAPRKRTFDVILVGHMRAEKDPSTPMRAMLQLPDDSPLRLVHIGDALSDQYADAARALQARTWSSVRRYRWLGGRAHGETRRRIARAQAMIVSSIIEGGANVIVEAVTSHVPVIASRIPGNIGMLGADYDGYFAPGDDAALARLLDRITRDSEFLMHLRAQCEERAPLFDPNREAMEVERLVDDALSYSRSSR